jgi:hypothetical protein
MNSRRLEGVVVEGIGSFTGPCLPVVGVSGAEGTATVFEVR